MLPSGLLIQWGKVSIGQDAKVTINLNKSFANSYYSVFLQVSSDQDLQEFSNTGRIQTSKTSSYFKVWVSSWAADWYWLAVGKA